MNPEPQISRRHRLKKWLFRRKTLKVFGWSIVTFITISVLFFQIERWRGARAWESAKKDYLAAGGTLEMKDLYPKAPPSVNNFGALPLFKEIALENSSLGEQNREKLRKARLVHGKDQPKTTNKPRFSDNKENFLKNYAQFLGIDAPEHSSQEAAKQILQHIDQHAGKVLDKMKLGVNYSKSQLTESPLQGASEELGIHTPLPHLFLLLRASETVILKGIASVEVGDRKTALESLTLALQLRDLVKNDFLVGLLVARAIDQIALELIQYGIDKQIWAPDDLTWIAHSKANSPLSQLLRGLQMEVISVVQYANIMKGGFNKRIETIEDPTLRPAYQYAFMPAGWIDLSSAKLLSLYLPMISLNPTEHQPHELLSAIQTAEQKLEKMNKFSPSSTLGLLIVPSVLDVGRRIIAGDIRQRLMRVSCAIEQYHIVNQRLPDNLAALVPQYLSELPKDPINQEPLRYQTHGKSGYTLYSIGIDQQDNQGKPSKSGKPKKGTDIVWKVRS